MSAAVSRYAVVAGQGLVSDEVKGSEAVCKFPGLCLVNPHQGSVDGELLVHREIEGDIERFDEGVPAVGIAAEVRLGHSGHKIEDASFPGENCRNAQKEKVPSGDECVREGIGRLFRVHFDGSVSQGVRSEMTNKRDVHHIEFHTEFPGDFSCHFDFKFVFLAVSEGQGCDLAEVFQCPEQTGR